MRGVEAVRVAAGAVALLCACACSDIDRNSYPDFDAAVRDGAIERGWIPAWCPPSATEIHETHNLDTDHTVLAFRFRASEPMPWQVACTEVGPGNAAPPVWELAGGAEWWPDSLTPAGWDRRMPMRRFRCPETTTYGDGHSETILAYLDVDERESRAYFWR